MIIKFETVTSHHYGEGLERHTVKVDGKIIMSQAECIEPEDAYFCRDLESPHNCEPIIKAVIAAMERGEKIEIEYTEEEDD